MSGPWEQYAQPQSNPWEQYAAQNQSAAPPTAAPQTGWLDRLNAGADQLQRDIGVAALRGVGSLGSTLMSGLQLTGAPQALAKRLIAFEGNEDSVAKRIAGSLGRSLEMTGDERRKEMDAAAKTLGADTNSLLYKGAKLATEVGTTWPIGGALAKGAAMIPGAARVAPGLIKAIETGGAVGGNLASRVAGGAITGGASAGLIDPNEATTGAVVGAALPIVSPALGLVKDAAKNLYGMNTGVGSKTLEEAYSAGKAGGEAGQMFRQNMRGEVPIEDVLGSVKQNLQAMGAQKQAAYREGMADISKDKTVLDFGGVDSAVKNALDMATYKGQVKNDKAFGALQSIKNEIDNWKALNPQEFHTPEGLDALKQKIGALVEDIPFEQKTARNAANGIYNSIKTEISNQAPRYSEVMKDYSEASELANQIERTLSQNPKATIDTQLRKLQSLMRNNVNTSYGYRQQLADILEKQGGQEFMPALAGQAVNDWAPRGIQRGVTGAGSTSLALTGNLLPAAGMAALSSPRLAGEMIHGLGRLSGVVEKGAAKVDPRLIEMIRSGAYKTAPVISAQ